mgnify:CR=1 FL=1
MPEGEDRNKRIAEEAERFMQWFQAIEFSHNRIVQANQKVEERDVFDIIERVLELQKQLQPKESSDETLKLISAFLKLITNEDVQKFVKELATRLAAGGPQ